MPFLHCQKKKEPWYKWASRETYRTGLRHKIFNPEGGYYKGDWVKGLKSGKGVELLPSGLQYEGDWLDNKKHGFGVRSRYDDFEKRFYLVYLGDYKNNKKDGFGCYHGKDFFFEGEFKDDKRHGFGRCWFKDGSYYEGYWVKGKKHGFGMLVQANGNRYEGDWRSDKKEGWGVFYHLDSGQKQIGFWKNEMCTTSIIEDIRFRQSALYPTELPMQKLELKPNTSCLTFFDEAKTMLLRYNEGCKLHKYCYKIPPPKSKKIYEKQDIVI